MTLSDSARKTIIGAAILHAESKETLAFDDFDFDEEDTPPVSFSLGPVSLLTANPLLLFDLSPCAPRQQDDKENQNYAKDMKEPEIEKNTSVGRQPDVILRAGSFQP